MAAMNRLTPPEAIPLNFAQSNRHRWPCSPVGCGRCRCALNTPASAALRPGPARASKAAAANSLRLRGTPPAMTAAPLLPAAAAGTAPPTAPVARQTPLTSLTPGRWRSPQSRDMGRPNASARARLLCRNNGGCHCIVGAFLIYDIAIIPLKGNCSLSSTCDFI